MFETQTRRSGRMVLVRVSSSNGRTDRLRTKILTFSTCIKVSQSTNGHFFQLARNCDSFDLGVGNRRIFFSVHNPHREEWIKDLQYLNGSKKEHFCMHNPQREEGIKMTPQKKTRHVRFSSLEIVELPYTIGDNPCVSDGCPVAASWLSQKKTEFDIDFFERHRPARRSRKALLLSAIDRNAL